MTLHVTNGDASAGLLRAVPVEGGVLPWRETWLDGPAATEWWQPEQAARRAGWLERTLGVPRGLYESRHAEQLAELEAAVTAGEEIVLWFEYDLFDQTILAALLSWFARFASAGGGALAADEPQVGAADHGHVAGGAQAADSAAVSGKRAASGKPAAPGHAGETVPAASDPAAAMPTAGKPAEPGHAGEAVFAASDPAVAMPVAPFCAPPARLSWIIVESVPGIDDFRGIGQLSAGQTAELLPLRRTVTAPELAAGARAWEAFAAESPVAIARWLEADGAMLPIMAKALRAHLDRFPHPGNGGLGSVERATMRLLADWGRSDWDRSERNDRSDRNDRNDRDAQSDRSDRNGRDDWSDRSDRNDRSVRDDRKDRNNGLAEAEAVRPARPSEPGVAGGTEAAGGAAAGPDELFRAVSEALPMLGMGDLSYWAVLNRLAAGSDPLVAIDGPPLPDFSREGAPDWSQWRVGLTAYGRREAAAAGMSGDASEAGRQPDADGCVAERSGARRTTLFSNAGPPYWLGGVFIESIGHA